MEGAGTRVVKLFIEINYIFFIIGENKMLNIGELTLNNKALFILYLLIASNYLNALYHCRLQELFETSMYVKHLFGFFTLFFFVILTEQSIQAKSIISKIWLTVKLYILFVLTTRMNRYLFIFVWLIFLVSIILSIEIENKKDEKKKEELQKYMQYLSYFGIIIITIGVLVYLGEKKVEYGKDFSYKTFIVGTPMCRGNVSTKSQIMKLDDFFKFLKIGLTK